MGNLPVTYELICNLLSVFYNERQFELKKSFRQIRGRRREPEKVSTKSRKVCAEPKKVPEDPGKDVEEPKKRRRRVGQFAAYTRKLRN